MTTSKILEGLNDTLLNGTKLWYNYLLVRLMDVDLLAWRETLMPEYPSMAEYLLGLTQSKGAKPCEDSTFVSYQALEILRHVPPIGNPGMDTIYLLLDATLNNRSEDGHSVFLTQEEVSRLCHSIPLGWYFERSLRIYFGNDMPTEDIVEIDMVYFQRIVSVVKRRTNFYFQGET